jgi:hypothetical protein
VNHKPAFFLLRASVPLAALLSVATHAHPQHTGVSVTGGSATGGSARGGHAIGGSAVGGSASGGHATGGSASGGSASAGSVTSGAGVATSGVATPGTATATIGGRRISATSDDGVSIQSEGNHARVQLGTRVVEVQTDRVLVDGKERARMSPSADLIQIRSTGGRLTVRAGTQELIAEETR